jgi:hypothetical protein
VYGIGRNAKMEPLVIDYEQRIKNK